MKHDFHLVINKKMKRDIQKLSYKLNKSLSGTVELIIKTLNPILERYHYIYPENAKDGKYRLINGKKHIHIYMDEIEYRRIKQVFANMYIYSMAIIVRRMIEIFIKEIKKYGFERFKRIMKKYEGIHKAKFGKLQRKWKKYDIFIQMSQKNSITELYKTIFTNNYTLLGFELL